MLAVLLLLSSGQREQFRGGQRGCFVSLARQVTYEEFEKVMKKAKEEKEAKS